MNDNPLRRDAIALVLLVANFVNQLNGSQLDDLLEGRSKLTIKPAGREGRGTRREKAIPSAAEIQAALGKLYLMQDREEGERLLEERFASKAALEALARHADLPVQSRDTIVSLRARVVESTIGYRLRSRAIQGDTGSKHRK